MEQKERDLIMREFRSGSSRVLITTDLLVCTITAPSVSPIIILAYCWTNYLSSVIFWHFVLKYKSVFLSFCSSPLPICCVSVSSAKCTDVNLMTATSSMQHNLIFSLYLMMLHCLDCPVLLYRYYELSTWVSSSRLSAAPYVTVKAICHPTIVNYEYNLSKTNRTPTPPNSAARPKQSA